MAKSREAFSKSTRGVRARRRAARLQRPSKRVLPGAEPGTHIKSKTAEVKQEMRFVEHWARRIASAVDPRAVHTYAMELLTTAYKGGDDDTTAGWLGQTSTRMTKRVLQLNPGLKGVFSK